MHSSQHGSLRLHVALIQHLTLLCCAVASLSEAAVTRAAPDEAAAAARPKKRRWDDALPQSAAASTLGDRVPQSQPPTIPPAAISQIDLLKQQIAERARRLNIPVTINAPAATASVTAAASTSHATPAIKSESRQWAPLRLDELGRQVDDSGQVVTVKREAELRVNQQQQQQPDSKRAKYAKAKKEKAATAEEDDSSKAYFDPSLPGGGKRGAGERQRRELRFVAAGTHEREAALMRRQIVEREMEEAAKAETMEQDEEQRKREDEERLAKEREEHIIVPTLYPTIPDLEWWDAAITTPQPTTATSTSCGTTINNASITSYIYHPIPTEALLPHILPPPKPIVLTLRERKKLRRRAKLDKIREQQQLQRQGLIPPPPPKLRLSNLMDVLVRESVAEPSEMERRVREEMRERQEQHERRNKEKKLTTEQRKEKAKRKMREKTAAEGGLVGTLVAVYAVRRGLTSRRARYLLDVNTAQCNLSGLAVMVRQSGDGAAAVSRTGGAMSEDERNGVSVLAVEGGPKGHRRFRRLMLHRIDWKRESERIDGQDDTMDVDKDEGDEDGDSSDEDEPAIAGEGNSRECVCVWRGVVAKGVFVGFKLEVCRSALQGRKVFGKAGVEQYWDIARAVQFVKPSNAVV